MNFSKVWANQARNGSSKLPSKNTPMDLIVKNSKNKLRKAAATSQSASSKPEEKKSSLVQPPQVEPVMPFLRPRNPIIYNFRNYTTKKFKVSI